MALKGQQIGTLGGAALGQALIPIPGVGMALGSLAGGIFGSLFDSNTDVEQKIQEALNQFEGIVPPDLAKSIVYTQLQQGGRLTPEQLSKLPEEAQQVVMLQENPEMRQKEMVQQQAMEQLAATGLGPEERYALEQTRLKAAQDAQARLKGLQQQYAQMGQAGGGAQLASQLSGLQESAQSEMLGNMQAAAMAAQNRRSAIAQAMQGAAQMRQQDLAVQESNVQAQRQRQMFDIQNSLARQRMNAEMEQQANMMNLQRQQAIMDANIQQANQERYRQQYLAPQQMYQNAMMMAQARAGIMGQQAALMQQQNAAQAQGWSNMVGAGLGFLGNYYGKGGAGTLSEIANATGNVAKAVTPQAGAAMQSMPQLEQPSYGLNYYGRQQIPNIGQGWSGLNYFQQMGTGGLQAGESLNYGIPNYMQYSPYNPYLNDKSFGGL